MPSIRHDRLQRRARTRVLSLAAGLLGAVAAPLGGAEVAPAPAAAEISGTVLGPDGEPAAGAIVAVVVARRSEPSAVAVADADGRFVATVSAGTYALTATHAQGVAAYSPPAAIAGKAVRELRLAAPTEGFLLAGEIRDSTGATLPEARVVCLRTMSGGDIFVGSADTSGRYALRLPSIEASWPESEAVDEYVRTGRGDPAKALAGLYIWPWNTEEVLDLVRWMRQWNAVPGHRQIRFYGFDVKAAAWSAERLAVRLQQIDPTLASQVNPALRKLAALEGADVQGAAVPDSEYLAAVAAVAAVLPRITARLPQPASATDRQALIDRHYVQVLEQYTRYRGGQGEWRDRGMADNVRWIADVAEPGSRLVVWAHNYHVNNFSEPFPWMGGHLEAALGKDYLPVGLLFHHGSFQAMDRTGGPAGLKEFTIGPPLTGSVEDTFERAGWPLCLLDLRRLPPSGPVSEWFRRPQPTRGVGSSFTGEGDMTMEGVLPDLYEAVIYVEATTRARPNPPIPPL